MAVSTFQKKQVFRPTNSKKVIKYGLEFDSTAEYDFYEILKRIGIEFEYQYLFNLTGETQYKSKKILLLNGSSASCVTLTVDFIFKLNGITYIVDTKGSKESTTAYSKLKYNLLKHRIIEQGEANETQIKFVYAKDVLSLNKITWGLYALKNFVEYFSKLPPI